MKYYIKAWFGGWKEVTKEKADSFIKGYLDGVMFTLTEEQKQEIIRKHYKKVDE